MNLTRRKFFGTLSTAIVGACVATNIPIGWLPAPIKKQGAMGYLTILYNNFYKKRGKYPKYISVGKELFEQYRSELGSIKRFSTDPISDPPWLAFKAARVELTNTDMIILS